MSTYSYVDTILHVATIKFKMGLPDAYHELEEFKAIGVRLLFELPKPVMRSALFRCADWFNRSHPHCLGSPPPWSEFLARSAQPAQFIKDVARSLEASTWDPAPWLCQDGACDGYLRRKPLFFDTDHLSGYGNDVLLQPFTSAVQAALIR